MPLFFLATGAALIALTINGNIEKFGELVIADLGNTQFVAMIALLVVVGFAGQFKTIKPVSDQLLLLILLVFFLRNGGFWDQLAKVPSEI